jgi:hypothetical protein
MQKPKLGVLHPGNMGISVAASAQNSGCEGLLGFRGAQCADPRAC